MLGLLPNPAFLTLFACPLDLLQQCPRETLEKAAYGADSLFKLTLQLNTSFLSSRTKEGSMSDWWNDMAMVGRDILENEINDIMDSQGVSREEAIQISHRRSEEFRRDLELEYED